MIFKRFVKIRDLRFQIKKDLFNVFSSIDMANPVIKILASLTFLFFVVGGILIFVGYQSLQFAKKADDAWEQVTLQQWLDGETENSNLFEISEFKAGEYYRAMMERYSDDFQIVYIPFFQTGQPEGDGSSIQVVVGVQDANNEQELEALLAAPTIKVQAFGGQVPLYAKKLSEAYPKIDWNKVRWVVADEDIPSAQAAWQSIGWGSAIASLGFVTVGLMFPLWWRRRSANRGNFADVAARLETVDATSEKRSELESSPLSDLWFKVQHYFGYCTTPLIGFNAVLVYGMRARIFDASWVMPILYVTVPLFLLAGLLSVIGNFFTAPKLKMERLVAADLPRKVKDRLTKEIEEFQVYGFQFIGFSRTNYITTKFNGYLLSSDGKRLIEVSDGNGEISLAALCITSDGLLYSLNRNSTDLKINGLETGVPLVAELSKNFTAVELVAGLEEFQETVEQGGDCLLTMSPSQVFHTMHYEAILTGWWTYNSSLRFSKPEPMPSIEEISSDGISFSFQRNSELDNAYSLETAESLVPQGVDADSLKRQEVKEETSVATFGGEELYSARFFKS